MRFYLDTSVFGGLFDKEFRHPTQKLFDFIVNRGVKIIYSDVLEKELKLAPEGIRLTARQKLLEAEYVKLNEKMSELAEIYVKEGALKE